METCHCRRGSGRLGSRARGITSLRRSECAATAACTTGGARTGARRARSHCRFRGCGAEEARVRKSSKTTARDSSGAFAENTGFCLYRLERGPSRIDSTCSAVSPRGGPGCGQQHREAARSGPVAAGGDPNKYPAAARAGASAADRHSGYAAAYIRPGKSGPDRAAGSGERPRHASARNPQFCSCRAG